MKMISTSEETICSEKEKIISGIIDNALSYDDNHENKEIPSEGKNLQKTNGESCSPSHPLHSKQKLETENQAYLYDGSLSCEGFSSLFNKGVDGDVYEKGNKDNKGYERSLDIRDDKESENLITGCRVGLDEMFTKLKEKIICVEEQPSIVSLSREKEDNKNGSPSLLTNLDKVLTKLEDKLICIDEKPSVISRCADIKAKPGFSDKNMKTFAEFSSLYDRTLSCEAFSSFFKKGADDDVHNKGEKGDKGDKGDKQRSLDTRDDKESASSSTGCLLGLEKKLVKSDDKVNCIDEQSSNFPQSNEKGDNKYISPKHLTYVDEMLTKIKNKIICVDGKSSTSSPSEDTKIIESANFMTGCHVGLDEMFTKFKDGLICVDKKPLIEFQRKEMSSKSKVLAVDIAIDLVGKDDVKSKPKNEQQSHPAFESSAENFAAISSKDNAEEIKLRSHTNKTEVKSQDMDVTRSLNLTPELGLKNCLSKPKTNSINSGGDILECDRSEEEPLCKHEGIYLDEVRQKKEEINAISEILPLENENKNVDYSKSSGLNDIAAERKEKEALITSKTSNSSRILISNKSSEDENSDEDESSEDESSEDESSEDESSIKETLISSKILLSSKNIEIDTTESEVVITRTSSKDQDTLAEVSNSDEKST